MSDLGHSANPVCGECKCTENWVPADSLLKELSAGKGCMSGPSWNKTAEGREILNKESATEGGVVRAHRLS